MLSEAQKKARLGRVTSSVVAEVLGVSPYGDGASAKKKILRQSSFKGSKATERGDLLEGVTLDYVVRVFDDLKRISPAFKPIEEVKGEGPMFSTPWAGDSIDAIYLGDNIRFGGEAKTVDSRGRGATYWGKAGTSEVPDHVRVQCLWHLLHWQGLDRIYVPVLFSDGFKFELYHVDRHQAAIDELAAQAFGWWNRHIKEDAAPVKSVASQKREARVETDIDYDEVRELVDRIGELKFNEKKSAKVRKPLEDKLRELLGRAETRLDTGIFKLSYAPVGNGTKIDWQGIVSSLHVPDEVIEKYTERKEPTFRLEVKETK